LSHSLGFQVTIRNCIKYHWKWVHCTFYGQQRIASTSSTCAWVTQTWPLCSSIGPSLLHYHTSTLEASTAYEDNASCVVLAHSKGIKVRTKHKSLKWHRFKDHVKSGDIKVVKIDSNLNWADIFTKPLCKVKHETWELEEIYHGLVIFRFFFSFSPTFSSHEGGSAVKA